MTDKQTIKTGGQHPTAVWRNGGFSASNDSFVVVLSAVLRLNFCAKNPSLRHGARHLDYPIAKWVKNKFKRLRSYQKAFDWLRGIKSSYPNMFVHWSMSKI